MRISTQMVYDSGVSSITRLQSSVLTTGQQISSGRRMLAPSDDPVGAAEVLQLSQTSAVNDQHLVNNNYAKNALGLEDSVLSNIGNLIQDAREAVINAGNPVLSQSDRASLANGLRQNYQELLGLANSKDSTNQFMFGGYQGANPPFSEITPGSVVYNGDQGQRMIRIGANRFIPMNDSGSDVFQRVKNDFGIQATPVATNSGTAVMTSAVQDGAKWNATAKDFQIKFTSATEYDILNGAGTMSMVTGQPPVVPGPRIYDGSAISLNSMAMPTAGTDYGATLTIQSGGAPATGDVFRITGNTSQDIFKTLSDLIDTLDLPKSSANQATYQLGLNKAISNLDNALDNVLTVRSAVGSRLKEVESTESLQSDLSVQYAGAISKLQDVDYAKTISDLNMQQMQLEAAQQSFVKTQSLSLFNYIN